LKRSFAVLDLREKEREEGEKGEGRGLDGKSSSAQRILALTALLH